MIALLQEIVAQRVPVRVPAGVIGQVWRDPARQVVISRLLRAHEVEVRALDDQLARACGVLCALTGDNDVIDASVVLTAREHGDRIFTSDPDDLRRLDPSASIHKV